MDVLANVSKFNKYITTRSVILIATSLSRKLRGKLLIKEKKTSFPLHYLLLCCPFVHFVSS